MASSDPNKPYILTIESDEAGQRLDNYLIKHLKGVPRGHLYRIVRKGEVRVNKKRCRVSLRLQQGDQVRIPPLRVSRREAYPIPAGGQRTLLDSVIYEDPHMMVLNKPTRWAVHGGSGQQHGIIETLKQAKSNSSFVELVHRLDKDTSGCLLIAKSRSVLVRLQQMLKSHDGQIEKYYSVLVKGRWNRGTFTMNSALSLARNDNHSKYARVDHDGKTAITRLKPDRCYRDLSLLDARISTGRMHQIRVHCAHLGHPVAGDSKYGDFTLNRQLKRQYGLARIFLHARELRFQHPVSGRKISIEAPLADDLAKVLKRIDDIDHNDL